MGITLKQGRIKHAQTTGILEKSHATLKTSLKMASGKSRKNCQKFLPLAILHYNTSYHTSLLCEPVRFSYGKVPYNIYDHKLGLKFDHNFKVITDFADKLRRITHFLNNKSKILSCGDTLNIKITMTKNPELPRSKKETFVAFCN